MLKIIQYIKQDKVSILVVALWSFQVILLSLNSFFNHAGFYKTPIDSIACYSVLLVLIILAIPSIIKSLSVKDLVFTLGFQFIFSATMALNSSQIDLYISFWPTSSFLIFPYYLLGATLKDFDLVEKILLKVSKWIIVISTIYLYLKKFEDIGYMHDMPGAYAILPTALILVYFAFRYGGIKNWFWSIFSALVIVFAGTRGPIVCFFGFVLLSLFIFNKRNRRKNKWYLKVWGILAIILFALANKLNSILESLYKLSVDNNINNLALAQFFKDDFFGTSDRDLLRKKAIHFIEQKPLTGYGIFGDRPLIGTYTHQFFVEVFFDFGIILGFILLWVLFFKIYKTLTKVKNEIFRYCFIWMVIFLSLVKLLMSNSYLEEPFFFLLLGLISSKYIDKDITKDPSLGHQAIT